MLIIWEYEVQEDRVAEFEKIYAPDGDWAELFKKGAGFLGTELIRSTGHPKRYVTIDRWASSRDYESFRSQWKEEYARLDAQCEGLTQYENCLGSFESRFKRANFAKV